MPDRVAPDERLILYVPLLRAFNLDLEYAGIEKKDQRGRTLDIHSLRHTFGTLLALSGVMPRTAMDLMRHSRHPSDDEHLPAPRTGGHRRRREPVAGGRRSQKRL